MGIKVEPIGGALRGLKRPLSFFVLKRKMNF